MEGIVEHLLSTLRASQKKMAHRPKLSENSSFSAKPVASPQSSLSSSCELCGLMTAQDSRMILTNDRLKLVAAGIFMPRALTDGHNTDGLGAHIWHIRYRSKYKPHARRNITRVACPHAPYRLAFASQTPLHAIQLLTSTALLRRSMHMHGPTGSTHAHNGTVTVRSNGPPRAGRLADKCAQHLNRTSETGPAEGGPNPKGRRPPGLAQRLFRARKERCQRKGAAKNRNGSRD